MNKIDQIKALFSEYLANLDAVSLVCWLAMAAIAGLTMLLPWLMDESELLWR
jgi:hypothetical protein